MEFLGRLLSPDVDDYEVSWCKGKLSVAPLKDLQLMNN